LLLKTLAKYPLIFITFWVVVGLVAAAYVVLPVKYVWIGVILSLIFLLVVHFWQNRQLKRNFFVTFWIGVISFGTGFVLHYNSDARHRSDHYIHFLSKDSIVVMQIELRQKLKTSSKYANYIGFVNKINGLSVTGKILVRLPVVDKKPDIGYKLTIPIQISLIKPVPTALNPYGFDYRKYMKYQNVYRRVDLTDISYQIDKSEGFDLVMLAGKWSEKIKKNFSQSGLSPHRLALAYTLLLGDRQELSPEILSDFKTTGTIHILAISGLHIGILLLFLNFIFKPVKNISRWLALILSLVLLWFYALLTGFSPSVLRAVIMFGFLAVGLELKRKTSVYNSLFAAALFMLIINPNYLYQIGFQMSFLAVLSIVSFYPVLVRLYRFNNKYLQWWFELFWVSLSAQLGVLPLSLYYFHQFPVYFLIANLLVVPLLFLVLFVGFGLMILSLFQLKITLLFKLFGYLLQILLVIIHRIAGFEYGLVTNIRFSLISLFISILGLMLIYYFVKQPRKFRSVCCLLVWLIVWQTHLLYEKYQRFHRHQYYVLHQYKTVITAEGKGDSLVFYQKPEKINMYIKQNFQLPYRNIVYDSFRVFQRFNRLRILHIDSLGIYNYKAYHPDIVILHHAPKINLDRMIEKLRPKQIVCDGTDYAAFVRRCQKSAQKHKVKFHDTRTQGAFVLTGK